MWNFAIDLIFILENMQAIPMCTDAPVNIIDFCVCIFYCRKIQYFIGAHVVRVFLDYDYIFDVNINFLTILCFISHSNRELYRKCGNDERENLKIIEWKKVNSYMRKRKNSLIQNYFYSEFMWNDIIPCLSRVVYVCLSLAIVPLTIAACRRNTEFEMEIQIIM